MSIGIGKLATAVVSSVALVALWGGTAARREEARAQDARVEAGTALADVAAASGEAAEIAPASSSQGRIALAPASAPSGARPGHARIQVLESDGAPSAGRLVVLLRTVDEPLASVRTDDAGWFELPASTSPREVVIERVDAFPHHALIERTPGEHELALPEGEVLEGRIVVAGGRPPRPVAMDVFPARSKEEDTVLGGAAPEDRLQVEYANVRSDAAGRFLVRGLRPAQGYNVRLQEGYARPGSVAVAREPLSRENFHVPFPTRDLVLEVERFPSLWGRLVDRDGRPTSGLLECLFTWTDGTGMHQGARAGDDGFFEVFFRPWRSAEIAFWGTPGERGRSVVVFEPDDVAPDGALGDLRLASGRDVRLRVVDEQGRPIPDARSRPGAGPTDANGETSVKELTGATLRVVARGHHEKTVDVPPEATRLEVVLARSPELALTVLAAGGGAPGEVGIELEGPEPFFDGPDGTSASSILSTERPGRLLSWGGRPFVAAYSTDAGGRLRMDSLRPGVPLVLRVILPGGVAHEERVPALGPGEWREHSIQLEHHTVSLRARVVDERGAAVVGASVMLPPLRSGNHGHYSYARTDGEGWFEALLLPCPDAILTISKRGFRTVECELAGLAGAEPTLVLARGLDLVVTVRDELGQIQGGGRLWVHEPGSNWDTDRPPVAPGRWEVHGLGDGELELELRIGGGETRRKAWPGSEVELRVPAMGAAEVSWDLAPAGAPEWLEVELRSRGRSGLRESFHSSPKGRHRFDPVLPGAYEAVLVVHDEEGELVLSRRSIEVRAGLIAAADL